MTTTELLNKLADALKQGPLDITDRQLWATRLRLHAEELDTEHPTTEWTVLKTDPRTGYYELRSVSGYEAGERMEFDGIVYETRESSLWQDGQWVTPLEKITPDTGPRNPESVPTVSVGTGQVDFSRVTTAKIPGDADTGKPEYREDGVRKMSPEHAERAVRLIKEALHSPATVVSETGTRVEVPADGRTYTVKNVGGGQLTVTPAPESSFNIGPYVFKVVPHLSTVPLGWMDWAQQRLTAKGWQDGDPLPQIGGRMRVPVDFHDDLILERVR